MKKLIFTLLACSMTLIVNAQTGDSTQLTQTQWRHALAVIAQYKAIDAGYGQKTETFESQAPQGAYMLDDLDAAYRDQSKWNEVYTQLKALENEDGTMARVKELASPELAKFVTRDMERFMSQALAQPEVTPDNAAPVPDTTQIVQPVAPDESGKGMNTHLIFDILLALLALGALALAWLTRRELNNLRRAAQSEVEATNSNMQQLADDMSQHVKTLLRRVSNIEANQRVMQPRHVERHDDSHSELTKAEAVKTERTYYLSKPDENDCFVRASEQFELGNSLFVLTTTDGLHGTFQVIDNRDVHRFALMMPTENLTRACSGNAIQMSAGMSRIVTDRPGEAQLDNGQWRVVVKAIIHYEA